MSMFTWLLAAIFYVLIGGVVIGFIWKRNAQRKNYGVPFPPDLEDCWPLVGGIIAWPVLLAVELGSSLFNATNKGGTDKK